MKRIFELTHGDVMTMSREELLKVIKASEGRTVMAETVISVQPLIYGVSNPETAAAFGADMITLNAFDFEYPFIFGIDNIDLYLSKGHQVLEDINKRIKENKSNPNYIRNARSIIGRFLGVNLEPVPEDTNYPEGRKLNEDNLKRAAVLGFDYVVITGNPNTGVTAGTVLKGIDTAAGILKDKVIIIAGKMHGAGKENIYNPSILKDFIKAGADVVMIPAPGTVPGMDISLAKRQIETIHEEGALAMTAMGTSQEGSEESVIEQFALMSKMAGADIQHIGDAGYAGMAFPENIMKLSVTIRGKRHTYRRMAYSSRK